MISRIVSTSGPRARKWRRPLSCRRRIRNCGRDISDINRLQSCHATADQRQHRDILARLAKRFGELILGAEHDRRPQDGGRGVADNTAVSPAALVRA